MFTGRDKAVYSVLASTDWQLLAEQKLRLIETIGETDDFFAIEELSGMLHFIDSIQDAAMECGFPVVWLTEDNINNRPDQT